MAIENNIQSLFSVAEVELVYRNNVRPADRIQINNSDGAYSTILSAWDMTKIELVEQFAILLLDRNNACLGISKIATGGFNSCIVDPKVVFNIALKSRASGFIMAHNHPSGSVTPSKADILMTNRIVEIGNLLDCNVIDHQIITPYTYYSFAEHGLMPG